MGGCFRLPITEASSAHAAYPRPQPGGEEKMMSVPSWDSDLVRAARPPLQESHEEQGQPRAFRAHLPARLRRPWFLNHFVAGGEWLPWLCSRAGSQQVVSA